MVIWHSLRGCGEKKAIFKKQAFSFKAKEAHKVMMGECHQKLGERKKR